MKLFAAAFAALVSFSAFQANAAPPGVQPGIWADGALATAVRSPTRDPKNVARDRYRHPRESLSFWGLRPGMSILEIWPGRGYWTEILAQYTKATNGTYTAALPSASRPLPAKFSDKALYGDVRTTVFNETSGQMVQPGSVDIVLL